MAASRLRSLESRRPLRWRYTLLLLAASAAASAAAHPSAADARLPVVGPAPDFTLRSEAGTTISLADLRGKVLALTFIYATCKDTCPIITAKMGAMQRRLGSDFGRRVRFLSVTVDPQTDTPAVLADYARRVGANPAGWSFLTGSPEEIAGLVRSYGGYARRVQSGEVDHLFLTSLIDRQGRLRVQYVGYRFDPGEMLRDLRSLMRE